MLSQQYHVPIKHVICLYHLTKQLIGARDYFLATNNISKT